MEEHGERRAPGGQVDPAVRSCAVGVDKRRFERVMVNLLENADHYGGGATVVARRLAPDDGVAVEIDVDDAGPGINPGERSKVFDRFYRGSHRAGAAPGTGTGLGLALVAEHMRVMHGARPGRASSGGRRALRPDPARAGRGRRRCPSGEAR